MATNPQRVKMNTALKSIFVPKLKGLGLKGTYPNFRMQKDGFVITATIQFSLYSRAFVVEFGRDKLNDLKGMAKNTPFEKLTSSYMTHRYRLGAKQMGSDKWFKFEDFTTDDEYDDLARQAEKELPTAEHFIESGAGGYL
jgi:hypothetical protein